MKIKKKSLVLGLVLVAVLVLSTFVVIASQNNSGGQSEAMAWGCPKRAGTCTPGQIICEEDLSNIHACEYKCQPGGAWGGANECTTNMCYGGKCDQGSIY